MKMKLTPEIKVERQKQHGHKQQHDNKKNKKAAQLRQQEQ